MSNITRYRGDNYPIVFNVTSNGSAVNITGWTFTLTINSTQKPSDTSDQILQLTGTLTNPTQGEVTFTMTTLQADIVPGKYFYDVQGVDGASVVRTFGVWEYVVQQDITKS